MADYSSAHISQVENGRVMPSESLVRCYIAFGGSPGRLLGLFDRARAARPLGGSSNDADELSDATADPYLLRRGYTVEQVTDRHFFGERHELLRVEHQAVVHQVCKGSRYFPLRYSYDDDLRPGVAQVRAGDGCQIAFSDEDTLGTVYAVLDFLNAPRDDTGAATLTWSITVNSQMPSRPRVVAGTSARLPVAEVSVNFADRVAAAPVFAFRDLDERVRPHADQPALSPDSDGRYGHRFEDLEREWWGLTWTWPQT